MAKTVQYNLVCSYTNCDKTFSKPSRLKHHLMTHTGDRPYICDFDDCDKSYTRAAHLKRHTEVVHEMKAPISPAQIRCSHDGCESTFASQDSLKKHLRVFHGGSLPYKCEEPNCGEAFRKKHQLKSHHYLHAGVLPFQCTEAGCNKLFSQKCHLDRHKKVHRGYPCTKEGCSEIFSKFSQLCHHQKISHKPVAEYLCPECGKRFHSSSWLTQHRQTHADARTVYKCPRDDCTRRYLDMRNLTAHIRSYHDRDRFRCTQNGCDRSFSTKQKRKLHEKSHDPNAVKKVVVKKPPRVPSKSDILKDLTGISKKKFESEDCLQGVCGSESDSAMDVSIPDLPVMETTTHFMDTTPECSKSQSGPQGVNDIQCERLRQLYGHPSQKCTSPQNPTHDLKHGRT